MSKKKAGSIWLMLIIALLLGGATFYLTQNYLKDKEAEIASAYKPASKAATKTVVVAVANINKGDILKGGMVAPVEYPPEYVDNGAVVPANVSQFIGQIMNVPMKRGQIVYQSYLGGGVVDRFSELLKDGETAVTLEVDAKKSNSHMLIPGDFVDILVLADRAKIEPIALKSTGAKNKNKLVPLLSKIKVLSVDRNPLVSEKEEYRIPVDSQGQIPTYSYITVGVPINDATKLALAQDLGNIVFFLRNAKDHVRIKVKSLDSLFSAEKKEIKLPEGTFEFYSGGSRGLSAPISKKLGKDSNLSIPVITSPALTFDSDSPREEDEKPHINDSKKTTVSSVTKEATNNE